MLDAVAPSMPGAATEADGAQMGTVLDSSILNSAVYCSIEVEVGTVLDSSIAAASRPQARASARAVAHPARDMIAAHEQPSPPPSADLT